MGPEVTNVKGVIVHPEQMLLLSILTCCLEGPCRYYKTLEEYALLKIESFLQGRGHVGWCDGEWDRHETFLQDVVHFEVAHDTALPVKDTQ